MTASIDWTDPAQVREEARRRERNRAEGKPLSEPEPEQLPPASKRLWPTAITGRGPRLFVLPRPRSLALEKAEQSEVIKVFQRFGVRKWKSTSQARRSKIGEGIPDVWVFGPVGSTIAFWWETKSGSGWRFSAAQIEFAAHCIATGTLYGCGDRFAAEVFCRALGLKEL